MQTKIKDKAYKQLCTIIMQKYANFNPSVDGNINLMFSDNNNYSDLMVSQEVQRPLGVKN